MGKKATIFEALQDFAAAVTAKSSQLTPGEPEDQLRGPFENIMTAASGVLGKKLVCKGETPLPGRLGKPDYGVHHKKLLTGYVELKAPGIGANAKKFTGHNRGQFKRFSAIPNIIYSDGNEWALYRSGELVGKIVRLSGDVATDGKKAVSEDDARAVERLLVDFLEWEPIIPRGKDGKIDLKGFAQLIAPLCRMLRDDVTDALKDSKSPLVQLAKDWRQLLFPDASDDQFADAYAQTVTFALLLGRSEGADPLTLVSAETALEAEHSLLSRALRVLTDQNAREEMSASLDLLLRVIAAVPTAALSGPQDPWIYFYEDFLAVYDPKLRKDAGAYYTPVEVVRAQVRLIDDLLVNRLNKPLGFADPDVVTLDPAAGTGTYLLGVIEHALGRVKKEQGKGAVAGKATELAKNLYGFEIMVGPYAVTELRVSRALSDHGATMPKDGTHVYLTDTLESPNAEPPALPLILKPISEQHAKALKIKSSVPVIVCLGNPPYDRHEAVDSHGSASLSKYGGWVRFGDELKTYKRKDKRGRETEIKDPRLLRDIREKSSILHTAFVQPALSAGHGVHVKNIYNLYVYFWRWALWKAFEHESSNGMGVVSFISASSYIDGDAFCGMREHMRRLCDEIWLLDLGGEGRGTRKDDNVFAIQTPVTIAVAVREKKPKADKPAKVHYARIEGARNTKLAALDAITDFSGVKWENCSADWQAPFRPESKGLYGSWPPLLDVLPWQHSGSQFKRTWPICPDRITLKHRWQALLIAPDRAIALKETRDRKITGKYPSLTSNADHLAPIAFLTETTEEPKAELYAYRSFDRQWILADNRLGDYLRPDLWRAHGGQQVYLTSLLTSPLGSGPALTACAAIPDLHHFSGRGAKDIVPLYRSSDAFDANIIPGLLDLLTRTYRKRKQITPEEFVAYVYGALAHSAFTERYSNELQNRELRVPITKDAKLFEKVREIGAHLLWLHTYGERFVPKGKKRGSVPPGSTKNTEAVPGDADGYPETFNYNDETKTLHVGAGEFKPVSKEVFEFEVSGLKVVQSWLKYRMKKGAGKKSSPLDDIRPEYWTSDFTTELLYLLWILEATLEIYPKQAALLEAVVSGECFKADELPEVPEEMRKPPKPKSKETDLFDAVE